MSTYDAILGSALTKFSKLVKKPERYMQSDSDLFDEIKLLSKESIHENWLKNSCFSSVVEFIL